jgi:hypothetical protein
MVGCPCRMTPYRGPLGATVHYARLCAKGSRARAVIDFPRSMAGEFEKLLTHNFVVGQSSKPNTFAGVGHAVVLVGGQCGPP